LIRQALLHLPGVGEHRLQILRECGIRTWLQVVEQPRKLLGMGEAAWDELRRAVEACEKAVVEQDLGYLCRILHPADKWRVLGVYPQCASFFDLETSGLSTADDITVVACQHANGLRLFTRGQNLDEFLELLENVKLLVSFNGNSFDVPQVLRHFNIPELPCAHLDLRWICWHAGFAGGLKEIERHMGIVRPPDLSGVDGAEAVMLWHLWQYTANRQALHTLVRYCGADALALQAVTAKIVNHLSADTAAALPVPDSTLWSALDAIEINLPPPAVNHSVKRGVSNSKTDAEQNLRDRLRIRLRGSARLR
jgi:uncharacterized protein YprB with RNaseH-like and TPR domain